MFFELKGTPGSIAVVIPLGSLGAEAARLLSKITVVIQFIPATAATSHFQSKSREVELR